MKSNYKESFEQIKLAGNLAAETLDEVTSYIKPGVTTKEIDKICYEFIKDNGGYSAPLFYRGFPKSCCTSVNHVVCHGIPTNKYLKEGDIVNVDVTAIINEWHGDTSRMFFVGDVSVKSKNLVSVTYNSMMKAIGKVKDGVHLGDIGETIQTYAEENGFSVVRDYCGHSIGKTFHGPPNILHYGKKGEGIKLKTGMIFTVEPMINEGIYNTKLLNDGWTAVTKDKSLSAQFEHTVGVTENGFEIFTKSKKKYEQPPYLI
uniref:Methionine aminopeptidase n=1 Tax=uncultured Alphaproteobacteria bacterium TaxID=91750 RepID=A0A1B0Z1M5_9PROT|nr:type I methionine aminopeptidase [uncultured Alphaproteobacteria bacterium]